MWLKKKVVINHFILESKIYNINKLKKKIVIRTRYTTFLKKAVFLNLHIKCKIGSNGKGKIKYKKTQLFFKNVIISLKIVDEEIVISISFILKNQFC